jgi:ACR3 family arsenite efflux pump ArsB
VLARLEIAHVNVSVGLLIWLMIVPMLAKIDFGALHRVTMHARGIAVTLFINWAVKPFSVECIGAMAAFGLAWRGMVSLVGRFAAWRGSDPARGTFSAHR